MHCPSCKKELGLDEYNIGEDEGSGDVLVPYTYWLCSACGKQVRESDDEFEYP